MASSDHPPSRKQNKKQIGEVIQEEELENIRLDNKKKKIEIEKLLIEKKKLEAEKELIERKKKAFMFRTFEEKFPTSVVTCNLNQ